MLHNKKAIAMIVVKLILGAVFLILLISIFFMGDSPFEKLADDVRNLIDGVVTKNEKTSGYNTYTQRELATNDFQLLAEAYKELAEEDVESCFYYLDSDFDNLFDDHKVKIDKVDAGVTLYLQARLKKQNDGNTDANAPITPITIEDVVPCLVYGTTQAKTFYEDYLKENGDGKAKPTHYQTYTNLELENYKIIIPSESESLLWDTEKKNGELGDYVLYLHNDAGKKNICLFPTRRGSFTKCDGDKERLDNDCFRGNDEGTSRTKQSFYHFAAEKGYPVWDPQTRSCDPYATTKEATT